MNIVGIVFVALGAVVLVGGNIAALVIARQRVKVGRNDNFYTRGGALVLVVGGSFALLGLALTGAFSS